MTIRKEITQFSRIEFEAQKAELELYARGALVETDSVKTKAMVKLYTVLKLENAPILFLGGFQNVKTIRVFEDFEFEYAYILDAQGLEKKKREEERKARLEKLKALPPQPPPKPKKMSKAERHRKYNAFLKSKKGAAAAYGEALKQRNRQPTK
jgi:hypothetical protein